MVPRAHGWWRHPFEWRRCTGGQQRAAAVAHHRRGDGEGGGRATPRVTRRVALDCGTARGAHVWRVRGAACRGRAGCAGRAGRACREPCLVRAATECARDGGSNRACGWEWPRARDDAMRAPVQPCDLKLASLCRARRSSHWRTVYWMSRDATRRCDEMSVRRCSAFSRKVCAGSSSADDTRMAVTMATVRTQATERMIVTTWPPIV